MRILMGLVFYPRGGSAQVVRYLSRALRERGHQVHLLVGSLRDGDPEHNAENFYGDLPQTHVDFTEAWNAHQRSIDPISAQWAAPLHPSYEDKPGVPDRSFYRVGAEAKAALVDCWREALDRSGEHDILHLHHLNHLHEAAILSAATTAKVAHLHGTELKMIEADPPVDCDRDTVEMWRRSFHHSAAAMQHVFASSPDVAERGHRLLAIDHSRMSIIPNGVDTELFTHAALDRADKHAFLRHLLQEAPRGWREGQGPGSLRYSDDELRGLVDQQGTLKPLVIFVGRFLGFKRVPMLMRAIARVNKRFDADPPFNVLVWGGMPGEWEGEHPHTVASTLGLTNVLFCGWLPHAILTRGLSTADLFVAPSYFEPFGQVFLEAMAVGLPCIGTRSGGPLSFIRETGSAANGWLVEVDDIESLADTLYTAITDEAERRRRGRNAARMVRDHYSWRAIAQRFVTVYQQTTAQR